MLKKFRHSLNNNIFMLGYLWRAKKSYIFISIFRNSIMPTLSEIMNILLFKFVYDAIVDGKSSIYMIMALTMITALQIASNILRDYDTNKLGPSVSLQLSRIINVELMEKVSSLDIKNFDDTEFYNNHTKAMAETDSRVFAVLNNMTSLLRNFLMICSVFSIIMTLDWVMLLFAIVAICLRMIVFPRQNKLKYKYNQERTPLDRQISFFKNIFFDVRYAKDFRANKALPKLFRKLYLDECELALDLNKKVGTKAFKLSTVVNIFENIFIVMLPYMYLAIRAFAKEITIGGLTALYSSMQTLSYALADFFQNINEISNSSLYIDNIRYMLSIKPEIDTGENKIKCLDVNSITFKNVSFTYPGNETKTLDNINFTINSGEKIAIVGANGAGKSTLVKLLLRLYDVDQGVIYINGIDIKKYDVWSLRNHFATTFQDFGIYPISLKDNILLRQDDDGIETSEIIKVLTDIGLYEKFENLDLGINTPITRQYENGVVLSGGEMQKIALCRAYMEKNASVFILDEPSSALDPMSENEFYERIVEIIDEKITLMITHRLSSLTFVDKVCFIDGGKLIAFDTFDHLMNNNKQFYDYYNLQAKYYNNYNTEKYEG